MHGTIQSINQSNKTTHSLHPVRPVNPGAGGTEAGMLHPTFLRALAYIPTTLGRWHSLLQNQGGNRARPIEPPFLRRPWLVDWSLVGPLGAAPPFFGLADRRTIPFFSPARPSKKPPFQDSVHLPQRTLNGKRDGTGRWQKTIGVARLWSPWLPQ